MVVVLTTPWLSDQPLDMARARARLRGGSHTDAEVDELLERLAHHTGVVGMALAPLVAQMAHETNNLRFGGQVRPAQHNYFGLAATNDGAAGLSFPTIDSGVRAGIAHHGNYFWGAFDRWPEAWRHYRADAIRNTEVLAAGYGGTVRAIGDYTNGRWAWTPGVPLGSLDNGYARAIVRIGNELLAEGATPVLAKRGHVPRPPIVVRPVVRAFGGVGVPKPAVPKTSGIGYDIAATPRRPLGSCLHSMVGTLWGTDSHFRLAATGALTDFGVGRKDMGDGYAEIIQWCDPTGLVVPWANGEANGIEGLGHAFVAAHGTGQINAGLVSVERDDGAVAGAVAPAWQWSSICWLLAYVHAELCGQTASDFAWQMIHKEFATKDCPHPAIYNHRAGYTSAVLAIMRHWQEGVPYPDGGVAVAGLRLAVPVNAEAGPVTPQTPAPGPAVVSPAIGLLRALLAA